MAIEWCDKCNEIKWDNHKCPPIWHVKDEDYLGDEIEGIMAKTAEDAAQEHCRSIDNGGDYPIIESGGHIVYVADNEHGPFKKYMVQAEMVAEYWATQL